MSKQAPTQGLVLNIAEDFSKVPGHRFRNQGPWSGEEFLERVLRPRFQEALDRKTFLVVEMDGVNGYATSFLEEAFGGLASIFGADTVERHIKLVRDEDRFTVPLVQDYIRSANPRPPRKP